MYRFLTTGSGEKAVRANLCNDEHPLLCDIEISVRNDSGQRVYLELAAGDSPLEISFNGSEQAPVFDHKKPVVYTGFLKLVSRNEGCLLICEAEISQTPFNRNRSFFPDGGIEISWTNPEGCRRRIEFYRHKDWWVRPDFTTGASKLKERGLTFIMEQQDMYLAASALSIGNFISEFGSVPDKEGAVMLSPGMGGLSRCSQPVLAFGGGNSPTEALARLYTEIPEGFPLREERNLPRVDDIVSHLGWCTWDAFYQEVNEADILRKMDEFKQAEIPVRWIIIDDGWMQTKENRLTAFEADPEKFPSGLRGLIQRLKSEYEIRQVGVWHTLAGYWGGIDPNSPIADSLGSSLLKTGNGTLLPDPDRGEDFWDRWYGYLKTQGVDFVKVDGQSAISNHARYLVPAGDAAAKSHRNLERSAGKHFSHAVLNCMGLAGENFWNRRETLLCRTSDDFVPEQIGTFPEHALQNLYNSLYHGFVYLGDFDMFWSSHPDALRHAVLRAISGGPVYISDPAGNTDRMQLLPLCDSAGRIPRLKGPAVPSEDSILRDPLEEPILLKAVNSCRGIHYIAAFHVSRHEEGSSGSISTLLVPDTPNSSVTAVYDVLNHCILHIEHAGDSRITLPPEGVGLFALIEEEPDGFITPIGLLEKYIPNGYIEVWKNETSYFSGRLPEAGTFGFLLAEGYSIEDVAVMCNGELVDLNQQVTTLAGSSRAFALNCMQGSRLEICRKEQHR